MKKIITFIICLCFIISSASVWAENKYTVDDNGVLVDISWDTEYFLNIPANDGGKTIRKISDNLCRGEEIGSIFIDDGVEEIGNSAFEGSSVNYISIPETIKVIGDSAFKNCKDLEAIALESDKIEFGKDALAGTGYLSIGIPCSVDTNALREKIENAKGDEYFDFEVMHTDIVESMVEQNIYGQHIRVCNACGEVINKFAKKMNFSDVSEDAWYYTYVSTAYEFGIINGKSDTVFDPNASMTIAEAAKIAACINMYMTDKTNDINASGEKWYEPYVNYCYENGIIDEGITFDWNKNATRAEMAYLFSNADADIFIINPDVPLTDIPDVDEETAFAENILALYRRGIAAGSNEYYAYYPDADVKRSEAATLISRILCYEMRIDLPKG